jgi:regulator of cell morphogenesis and NO signaling
MNAEADTGAVIGEKEGLFSPLIDEILKQHNQLVREDTPRINAILEKCAKGCGESVEAIGAVSRFFGELAEELTGHFKREEEELFPALLAAEEGRPHKSIAPIIRKFEAEHDHAGDALTKTRVSLAEVLLPEGAQPEIKELHTRLQNFERDIWAHVRIEDLLFARASSIGGRPAVGRQ